MRIIGIRFKNLQQRGVSKKQNLYALRLSGSEKVGRVLRKNAHKRWICVAMPNKRSGKQKTPNDERRGGGVSQNRALVQKFTFTPVQ